MKTIAVTIQEDMLERIDRLSAGKGMASNRSRIIRDAVQEYLSKRERQIEEERETQIFRRHKAKLALQAAALVKEQAKR